VVILSHAGKVLLYWAPRALCIAFALFLSVFALDVFSENRGFWQTALALGLHLIPSAIVVLILIVAWRREWIGAVLFAAVAIWYSVGARRHPDWILTIGGPLFVVAALFLTDWLIRRQAPGRHHTSA